MYDNLFQAPEELEGRLYIAQSEAECDTILKKLGVELEEGINLAENEVVVIEHLETPFVYYDFSGLYYSNKAGKYMIDRQHVGLDHISFGGPDEGKELTTLTIVKFVPLEPKKIEFYDEHYQQ